MSRRKIFLLYPYYWPLYKAGGPVQSLYNLVTTFKAHATFYLVSQIRDVGGEPSDFPIKENAWSAGPNNENIYYTKTISPVLLYKLLKEIEPDAVHINGIFHWHTTFFGLVVAKILGVEVIISPRGMLQKWALEKRRVKKKLYLFFFSCLLSNRESWHATDEQEKDDIRKKFGADQVVHVASNIPRKVSVFTSLAFPDLNGKIRLVFLSLINPNKNLHLIIEAVKRSGDKFSLDIYGPVADANYWKKCQEAMIGCDQITYYGSVPPWDVPKILAQYHFFILPTEGENFGHAIFDALSSGVPVIISDRTPWKDIDSFKAGFYLDLTDEISLPNLLQKVAALSIDEYGQCRANSIQYAAEYLSKRNFNEEYSFLLKP